VSYVKTSQIVDTGQWLSITDTDWNISWRYVSWVGIWMYWVTLNQSLMWVLIVNHSR